MVAHLKQFSANFDTEDLRTNSKAAEGVCDSGGSVLRRHFCAGWKFKFSSPNEI